ncbi:hypothetical protein VTO58DRAFT_110772 [Aureobasidium pullulans]
MTKACNLDIHLKGSYRKQQGQRNPSQCLQDEIKGNKSNAVVLSHKPLQTYEATQATLRGLKRCLERPIVPGNAITSIGLTRKIGVVREGH